MGKIRFVIADDHSIFRTGLCRLLTDVGDLECVGEASNGKEAVELAETLKPEVMLIDIDMPILNGYEAAKQITENNPDIALIMLSAFDYDAYVLSSLRAGARGYILKNTPIEKLIQAVRLVHEGQIVLDSSVGKKLGSLMYHDNAAYQEQKLTFFGPRELEIIRLTARGLTNKEIADEINVSPRTVQAHMVNIFRKSGTNSRTQAVYFALQKGWITINEADLSRDVTHE